MNLDRFSFKAQRRGDRVWMTAELRDAYYPDYGVMWSDGELRWASVEIDPKTLCLCTGLKDSDNALIYENDYLKIVRADDKSVINAKAKVEYDNLQWFCSLDNGERYPLSRITNSVFAGLTYEFYVVGNVFDEV